MPCSGRAATPTTTSRRSAGDDRCRRHERSAGRCSLPDEHHGPRSAQRLRTACDRGAILVCDVVYAELVPAFDDRATLDRVLREIGATPSPIDTAIAHEAGVRWRRYRRAGGPRERIITDFLIGAHALAAAEAFLTRDRGFYTTYFPELALSGSKE